MAFFDKLNEVAKNIGDRTSDAIETTKLNSKISAEKQAAGEVMKKIGQHYYDKYINGEVDEEILEYCQTIKAHMDAINAAQQEIEGIKSANEAAKAATVQPAATPVEQVVAPAVNEGWNCPTCNTANPAGTKFCANCGTKMEPAPAPQIKKCSGCGAEIAPGVKFCNQCGTKVE